MCGDKGRLSRDCDIRICRRLVAGSCNVLPLPTVSIVSRKTLPILASQPAISSIRGRRGNFELDLQAHPALGQC